MTLPTIHMNGTSPDDLLAGYRAAMDALTAAADALTACFPNARDYYVQDPQAFPAARAEHDARREAVRKVYDEVVALAMHCNDAIMEREERRRAAGLPPLKAGGAL